MKRLFPLGLVTLIALFMGAGAARAVDYVSVSENNAILYDARRC